MVPFRDEPASRARRANTVAAPPEVQRRYRQALDRRRVVVVKASSCAGLGDRLLAALTAATFCELTSRALLIDWRDGLYATRGTNAFSLLLESRHAHAPCRVPEFGSVFPEVWSGHLDWSLDRLVAQHSGGRPWNSAEARRTYSFDFGRLDYPHEALVCWDFEQASKLLQFAPRSPHHRSEGSSTNAMLARTWRKFFTPVFAVADRVDRFAAAHFQRAPVIGVHSRCTVEGSDRSPSPSTILEILDTISDAVRRGTLFVSSDNIAVVKEYQRIWPSLTTTTKWYPRAGQPMHLGCAPSRRVQNGRAALVDLLLLSRCDSLIYPARSSFSTAAAIIGRLSEDDLLPLVAGAGR